MVYIVVITSIVNLCISDKYLYVVVTRKRKRRLSTSEPVNQQKKENDVIQYDSTVEQQHEDVPR